MVVAGRAAGRRRREVKERSRSGLCGRRREEEGGR